MRYCAALLLALMSPLLAAAEAPLASAAASAPSLDIISTLPHDDRIFTQGLALDQGRLYQSSGLRGRSQVLVGTVDGSGVSARYHFEPRYFAEGLTIVGEHAMVLTWKAGELFVLDKSNLRLQYKLSYPGEGWGLAYDGQHLWLSDGSEHIARYTPDSMTALGSIEVHDERGPVRRINELEYARGLLYANIWLSPRLIAIDPNSGRVVAEWDLRGLLPKSRNFGHEAVANGIAYDPDSGHFWLTGKGWPLLYEVRLYGVDGHSSR